jgi:group I intron endonuclease
LRLSDEHKWCIYIHRNLINNKIYVGISKNPLQRWCNGKGYQHQAVFGRAIQKYGWDNFEHKILFTNLTLTEANWKEKEAIKFYHTFVGFENCNGYNMTLGGDGICAPWTEERRQQFLNKHFKQSQETINKRIATRKRLYYDNPNWNNPNKGRKRSQAEIDHWKESRRNSGYVQSEETRRKHSIASTGKHHSQESIQKMIETKKRNGTLIVEHSETHKQHLLEANSKKVMYDGVEYSCLKDCLQAIGLSKSSFFRYMHDECQSTRTKFDKTLFAYL